MPIMVHGWPLFSAALTACSLCRAAYATTLSGGQALRPVYVLVAGPAIFGDRHGVGTVMNALRTALNDTERHTKPADPSAL